MIGIILSIIIIFLALKNLSWLYRLVGVCAIIYYLIDIEQKLEEDHAITKIVRIFIQLLHAIIEHNLNQFKVSML